MMEKFILGGYQYLGTGSEKEHRNYPVCLTTEEGSELPKDGTKIVEANISMYSSMLIDENGKMYVWGLDYDGIGNGNQDSLVEKPICLNSIEGHPFNNSQVKISQYYESWGLHYVVDSNGKLYSWGDNYNGALGIGTNTSKYMPTCISDDETCILYGKKVLKLYTDYDHCILLADDGNMYAIGRNTTIGITTNVPVCINDYTGNDIIKGKKIIDFNSEFLLDDQGKLYMYKDSGFICLNNSNDCIKDKKITEIVDYITVKDQDGKKYFIDSNVVTPENLQRPDAPFNGKNLVDYEFRDKRYNGLSLSYAVTADGELWYMYHANSWAE